MTPEAVLGLVLAVGPYPGGTLYSQTPVAKDAALVISTKREDHGRSFKAYRLLAADEAAPYACTQRGNPVCRRPRRNVTLKRWERPETYWEGMERYWGIANAISATQTSSAVLDYAVVVFRHESGMFRRDVHEGTNHRPYRRSTKHEDGGLAWSFGQIHWSTLPTAKIPIRGFKHLTLGEMVGLDDRSTSIGVSVPIERLRRIVKRCGATNPSCVFTSYGGTVSSRHPFIKARLATYARVRRLKKKDRTLSAKVREALGVGDNS
ncbi:MAG: hypothetical protein V3W41_22160 [Planctomycetota bacterium]